MKIENTKQNREIANVASSLAIENMYYLSNDFINEFLKVSNGEKTSEELRQEIIKKYQSVNNA